MSVCGVLGMSNLLHGLWLIVLFVLIFTDSRLAVAWFMGTALIVIIVSETSWRTLILSLGAAALFASAVVFVIRYLAEETRTPEVIENSGIPTPLIMPAFLVGGWALMTLTAKVLRWTGRLFRER